MDVTGQPGTFFVTGATGFIGSRLVAELVRRGHVVRALARPTSSREGLEDERITVVVGDIGAPASLRAGMEGCSGVFHLAAYARNWARDPSTFFELNVGGTRNVLAAARASGVARIVLTSTIVTFGPTPPGVVGDEEMPRSTPRFFTEYEESKAAAEREALRQAADALPVVIVNPTRVYGSGKLTEGNSTTIMIDLYDRGRFPVLLAGGVNVGNYAFVDDLVRGHLLAMARGRVGERYILGGENVSLARLFDLVDEATGKRHLRLNLPARLAAAYAEVEKKKAKWLGLYPRITPGWVETFLRDWAYSSAKAERELGYTVTPLKEGIGLTCEWLHGRRAKP
ncbi:MAG TPA: NAD-dependent epimerase/dehydratase family protein [Thermoanaerobaculaceae bacterium]|nr:NAD-dependent epimerase/dehydratase family protein [Thermoanaerobaculaceae bacterium]